MFLPRSIFCLAVFVGSLCMTLPVQAEVVDIDNKTLHELLKQGVPVIDVRRAEEWSQTGIVEGSHLMTFFDKHGRYDAARWLAELKATVDTEKPLILICHSGGRTSMISKWLVKELGTVYNVDRGIVHWIVEKYDTVAP